MWLSLAPYTMTTTSKSNENSGNNMASDNDDESDDDDDSIYVSVADGDDFNDDVLAFIDDEGEAERPTRTSAVRSIILRSENDFFPYF